MIVCHAYDKENSLSQAPDVKDICFYNKIIPCAIIIIIMLQEIILL